MRKRSNLSTPPSTVDVRGVLGTFRVPNASLTVEYILTYASLDDDNTTNGQLLDLLVPVREVFSLKDLDFDHLLQRDLDDYRVSEEMVPYLLGKSSSGATFSAPRFFPPIVAIIVPTIGTNMNDFYPPCTKTQENDKDDAEIQLKVFKYGNVFTVKREEGENGELAQSSVDLCIHPTHAKLVIVDGQHRAMAMLAAHRNKLNKWSGNEFQYFYKKIETEIPTLDQIHLPVCIAYFPELTSDAQEQTVEDLRTACRKLFLDVNKNARQPSKARQILLDDTDLVACFTRHIFNMVKNNTETGMLQLHHTEYDNPHDKIPITRPLALTNVYTIYNTIRCILLANDQSVWNSTTRYGSGRPPENNNRLRRELDMENALTESDKEQFNIKISNIEQNNYPRQGEVIFRQCFEEGWGQVIVNSLSKFYPFSQHIKAVDTTLEACETHRRENQLAYTALVEGQGLRHILDQQQKKDLDDNHRENGEKSGAQKAWEILKAIEEDFKKCRTKLYLNLGSDPDENQTNKVNRLFDCFCSNAFQSGLFMAFAYLKVRMRIRDNQKFVRFADKWIDRLNERFQSLTGIRDIMFDHSDPKRKSLRYIYKPDGGLNPSDSYFFRYLILELLSVESNEETECIEAAQKEWREKLYTIRYDYRIKIDPPPNDNNEKENFQKDLDKRIVKDLVDAFKNSLDINEDDIKRDLEEVRQKNRYSVSAVEDEDEVDERDD